MNEEYLVIAFELRWSKPMSTEPWGAFLVRLQKVLNSLGRRGWVNYHIDGPMHYFKRPSRPDSWLRSP